MVFYKILIDNNVVKELPEIELKNNGLKSEFAQVIYINSLIAQIQLMYPNAKITYKRESVADEQLTILEGKFQKIHFFGSISLN